MREPEFPRIYPEKDKEVFGGVGCSALWPSSPSAVPTRPPEGSKCTKHKLFGTLVLQQVAGERSRWEEVRDDVPSLRSLLPWATPAPPSRGVTRGEQCLAPGATGAPSPIPSRVTCKGARGAVCRGSRRRGRLWTRREAVSRRAEEWKGERKEKGQARETGSAVGLVGI